MPIQSSSLFNSSDDTQQAQPNAVAGDSSCLPTNDASPQGCHSTLATNHSEQQDRAKAQAIEPPEEAKDDAAKEEERALSFLAQLDYPPVEDGRKKAVAVLLRDIEQRFPGSEGALAGYRHLLGLIDRDTFEQLLEGYATLRGLSRQQTSEEVKDTSDFCKMFDLACATRPAILIAKLFAFSCLNWLGSLIPWAHATEQRAAPLALWAMSKDVEHYCNNLETAIKRAIDAATSKRICAILKAVRCLAERVRNEIHKHRDVFLGKAKQKIARRTPNPLNVDAPYLQQVGQTEAITELVGKHASADKYQAHNAAVAAIAKATHPASEPKQRGGKCSEYQDLFNEDKNACMKSDGSYIDDPKELQALAEQHERLTMTVDLAKLEQFRQESKASASTEAKKPGANSGCKFKYSPLIIATQSAQLVTVNPSSDALHGQNQLKYTPKSAIYWLQIAEAPDSPETLANPESKVQVKLLSPDSANHLEQPFNYQGGAPADLIIDMAFACLKGEISRNQAKKKLAALGFSYSAQSLDKAMTMIVEAVMVAQVSCWQRYHLALNRNIHADESPVKIYVRAEPSPSLKGKKSVHYNYVLTVCSSALELFPFRGFIRVDSRKSADIKAAIEQWLPTQLGGCLLTDRYQVYIDIANEAGLEHMCCIVHAYNKAYDAISELVEVSNKRWDDRIEQLREQHKVDKSEPFEPSQEDLKLLKQDLNDFIAQLPNDEQVMFAAVSAIHHLLVIERQVAQLWDQVIALKFKGLPYADEDARVRNEVNILRNTHSVFYLHLIDALMESIQHSKVSKIAAAAKYWCNGAESFATFLRHPDLSAHNNLAERMMKVISSLRKAMRVTQSTQKLEIMCVFHTCLQTMTALGYPEEIIKGLVKHILDLRFKHALEFATVQHIWLGKREPLQNVLLHINPLSFSNMFNTKEHILNYLEHERERLIAQGYEIMPLDPKVTKEIILTERDEVNDARDNFFAFLASLASQPSSADVSAA